MDHGFDHLQLTLLGARAVACWIVAAWRLKQAGDQRRLFRLQGFHTFAKVPIGRGANAIGAVTEEHRVSINGEDLFFSHHLLQLDRQSDLLDFTLHRPFRGQKKVADDLLGQGTCALVAAAATKVSIGSPGNPFGIKSLMLPEAAVLDRQDCLHQTLW